MSSGGLVSALSGLKKIMSFTWIGWPGNSLIPLFTLPSVLNQMHWLGLEVAPEEQATLSANLLEKYSCVPVFLSNEVADLHYNGFSNSTLWPLFHYLPGEIDFDEMQWDGYYRANTAFAAAVRAVARDGDMIWVQDYHLMLLPALLREMLSDMPNIHLGFFLHTPFPSSEVYRVLPVRKQLLLGVLHCDLIGFHTYDYARHFISSCSRILGLATMPNGIEFDGRYVHVGAFPIGIEPELFSKGLESPIVQEKLADLQGRFAGKLVMIGVDRLDYIKGVPHKLHAFDLFLSRHPEFENKVVLIQVAVPTRTEVEEYKNLRTSVNELVGRINGKFGTFDHTPVQYLYRSVSFEELVALYRIADVCVVTSTRDGMNLVSYEYIATQAGKGGALVLSEFAGAAQSLNGAIIINPWNIEELAEAYYEALTMPPGTAENNHQKLLRYINKHTASFWGQSFVDELSKISRETQNRKKYTRLTSTILRDAFQASRQQRLLILDYDGTLNPAHHVADFSRPSSRILDLVCRLSHLPRTSLYLLSGRTRAHLENSFDSCNVGLVAEHGCFIRHPLQFRLPLSSASTSSFVSCPSSSPPQETINNSEAADDWIFLAENGDDSWRELIRPLLKFYTDHTPGSFVEEKEKISSWHFREADPEFGSWQAAELQASLEKLLSHVPVSVMVGPKALELRPALADKARAIRRIISDLSLHGPVDLIICVGDARTEEAAFAALEASTDSVASLITATIGKRNSSARYYIESANDLLLLLGTLTSA